MMQKLFILRTSVCRDIDRFNRLVGLSLFLSRYETPIISYITGGNDTVSTALLKFLPSIMKINAR